MSYETNKEKNGMGTKIFITIYNPNSFIVNILSPREGKLLSNYLKINTKVIIVLVCVTYNIQCMKVIFLTVNIKLFPDQDKWLKRYPPNIYFPVNLNKILCFFYIKKKLYKMFTSKQTCFNKQCSEKYIYS